MRKLPHSILKDAIDFALSNPVVKNWLNLRDNDPKLTIKEFKTKIIGISNDNQNIGIQLGIDYVQFGNPVDGKEDVLIDINWNLTSGFSIRNIRAIPVG